MKIIKGLLAVIKKIYRWYREPITGQEIFRVDPVTALVAMIGLSATFWNMGRGMGVERVGVELANELRNAPGNYQQYIETAYNANEMTAYEREAALQRVDLLSNIYLQTADVIESRAHDTAFQAALQAFIDTLQNYIPGEQAGTLAGVAVSGERFSQVFSIASIANDIQEFELFPTPFSEEETLLNQQIQQVMGMDQDALFLARIRTKINLIREWYIDSLKKNPCNADQVLAEYRAELINLGWGRGMELYGPGEKWPTYESFIDWLIAQARSIEGDDMTLTMSGDFTMTNTPTKDCTVCVPPAIPTGIKLVINLETCEVSGTFIGEGAGTATAACDGKDYTATGTAAFSGSISGTIDQTGTLKLNQSSTLFDYSWNFIDEIQQGNAGKVNVNFVLEGQVDWSGTTSGTIQLMDVSTCAVIGEWSAFAE